MYSINCCLYSLAASTVGTGLAVGLAVEVVVGLAVGVTVGMAVSVGDSYVSVASPTSAAVIAMVL